MFDAEQYVQRMNEAEQRASVAPTNETRLSWQNIQQGWEAVIRIQRDILNAKSRTASAAVSTSESMAAQEPVRAEP